MKSTGNDSYRTFSEATYQRARLIIACLALTTSAFAQSFQSVESIHAIALTAIADADSAGTSVELGLDPQLKLPQCAGQLSATQSGRHAIEVSCPEAWRLFVPIRIRRVGPVLVLARAVAAGTLLEPTHLRIEERDLSRQSSATFASIESVAGKQAARSLGAGSVLTMSDVKSPIGIRRGDAVTMVARTGGIEVRAAGRAVTDGRLDETLAVRNMVTQRVLQGILRENGVVELSF